MMKNSDTLVLADRTGRSSAKERKVIDREANEGEE
jgi:hypothetical protein